MKTVVTVLVLVVIAILVYGWYKKSTAIEATQGAGTPGSQTLQPGGGGLAGYTPGIIYPDFKKATLPLAGQL